MGFVTKYGSFWGMIPQTSGRVFWVAPSASYTVEGRAYSASDNNDGLSPERAVLTLDYAIGLCTANVGDVIVLLPGSHSWSASVAVDVAGITITGLPSGKGHPGYKRTSITTTATADQVMNVTAANVEIAHLRIIPITAATAIDYTADADNLYIHDCSFDMYTPAVSTSTKGVAPTTALINADHLRIENCYFETDGAQGFMIDVGSCSGYVIEGNTFINTAGVLATACEDTGLTAGVGVWIGNRMLTVGTAAITKGINGGNKVNTESTGFMGNFFGGQVTTPIDTYSAGDAWVAENYQSSIGGGSGGALITAIT